MNIVDFITRNEQQNSFKLKDCSFDNKQSYTSSSYNEIRTDTPRYETLVPISNHTNPYQNKSDNIQHLLVNILQNLQNNSVSNSINNSTDNVCQYVHPYEQHRKENTEISEILNIINYSRLDENNKIYIKN